MRRLWIAVTIGAAVFGIAAAPQDAARGKDLFERRCSGCHALDQDKEGPRLGGVYGRVSGSVVSFTYSDALRQAKVTWDADSLNRWLTDPEKMVPGNDMAFHVGDADERGAIIAYLREIR